MKIYLEGILQAFWLQFGYTHENCDCETGIEQHYAIFPMQFPFRLAEHHGREHYQGWIDQTLSDLLFMVTLIRHDYYEKKEIFNTNACLKLIEV